MLLAIDVGNTNAVFAVFKGEQLLDSWRLHTENTRSADEYAAFLNQVFDLADMGFQDISDVFISSVVPETNFHIEKLCKKYIGKAPVFITKDNVGIELAVDRPEDVGADRLVNALAVKTHYKTPAVVIDFGTATTFDVISADGAYAGGVIAPGINLSINALHQAASKLPKISVYKPDQVIGKTTVEAMRSGVYWGYTGLIERILAGIQKELDSDVQVLATGGLAKLFAKDSDLIELVDEDLTLKGIHEIYKSLKS